MARKGNPISVRRDLNRSSDSSRFSEGDRESHRMGQSFSLSTILNNKKSVVGRCRCPGRTRLLLTLEDHWKTPGPEHVVKEAHWAGVLRPCLRGTVECRYHEREVQDTRPRKPGNHSPMRQSLVQPGPRRPAPLERPRLI